MDRIAVNDILRRKAGWTFRRAFNLVEVLIASVIFFVLMMVFQSVFSAAHGGEGRDLRRTQALLVAAELLEQICVVHQIKGDLPLLGCQERFAPWPKARAQGEVLFSCHGGQVFTSPEPAGFQRFVRITEFRSGRDDQLIRPDRSYLIEVRVRYPGPFAETREVTLTTTRSRVMVQKPRLEGLPWQS